MVDGVCQSGQMQWYGFMIRSTVFLLIYHVKRHYRMPCRSSLIVIHLHFVLLWAIRLVLQPLKHHTFQPVRFLPHRIHSRHNKHLECTSPRLLSSEHLQSCPLCSDSRLCKCAVSPLEFGVLNPTPSRRRRRRCRQFRKKQRPSARTIAPACYLRMTDGQVLRRSSPRPTQHAVSPPNSQRNIMIIKITPHTPYPAPYATYPSP